MIPDELTTLTAAALLTDGRTAVGIFDVVSVKPHTSVLITGAAGRMGLALVQLATALGAPRGRRGARRAQAPCGARPGR